MISASTAQFKLAGAARRVVLAAWWMMKKDATRPKQLVVMRAVERLVMRSANDEAETPAVRAWTLKLSLPQSEGAAATG